MKRLGFCALLFGALVSIIAAQSQPGVTGPERASARPAASAPTPKTPVAPRASGIGPIASHRTLSAAEAGAPAAAATFEKYCSDCHTGARAKANIDFDKLTERMTPTGVAEKADIWDDVVLMLESRDMPPPDDADDFPTDAERARPSSWIRTSLGEYDAQHAGDPGRVTVRRLTSAEYAYAIRDLTGVDIKVGIDASSDSVGGEGFANFGDVQFVQDAQVERYLEAAKQVADHAVIGSGPLGFYADRGRDRPGAVGARSDRPALRDEGLPRRLGRRRPAVRLRALRQGVLRRVALQAPRGARRSDRRRSAAWPRRKASPAASPSTSGRSSTAPGPAIRAAT